MTDRTQEQGFIGVIVLIIIALVLLQNVFKVDVIGFIQSSFFGNLVVDVKNIVLSIWDAISRALSS